jgi:hypothetical protein
MKQDLVGLGIGNPWKLVRGIYDLARTIWNPARSDVQHGINALVSDALRDATPWIVSYSLGQVARNPGNDGRAPALALAVLLMHIALRRPTEFRESIRLAYEWMQLGERSRAHVPLRIEEHLGSQIASVRELVLASAA